MSKATLRSFVLGCCSALLGAASPALAQDDAAIGFERTPPRLSFADGEVSFLRPGAKDWTPAQVNTALAAGDELYSAASANLELQIGPRAFVRAGENTQLGLTSLEPDFLQLRVTSGHLSLDLRSLPAGQTIELDTPNAAFTVERSGYYRVEVDGETTTFASRRGGRASLTPAAGDPVVIAASEQVVVTGADAPQIASYAAPELDAWDRWNYTRTDDQIDAVSARYLPSGVYGADDLDHYGDWRVVPTYGALWVPRGVAVGWAPYSSGRWIYDPYYAWTWVDSAPWGWAPYHYGRWVHVSGYWGWCPGPIIVRPFYSPALVAFYGGHGFSVGFSYGAPYLGWVALGWGEPVVRWWGPARFRGHPYWGGWGGPRIVNNVVVKNKTVIKGDQVNVFQNAGVRGAIVGVDRNQFGRRSGGGERFTRLQADGLTPLHGNLDVKPDRSSLAASERSGQRPPRESWNRSVVATREPRLAATPALDTRREWRATPGRDAATRDATARTATDATARAATDATPRTRVVQPPRDGRREIAKRPPFGNQSDRERSVSRAAPRFAGSQRPERDASSAARSEPTQAQPPERRRVSSRAAQSPPAAPRLDVRPRGPSRSTTAARVDRAAPDRNRGVSRREMASSAPRSLPGEPANRVYRPSATRGPSIAREAPMARQGSVEQGPSIARQAAVERGSSITRQASVERGPSIAGQSLRAERSQPNGAARSQPNGAARSQPNGAERSQPNAASGFGGLGSQGGGRASGGGWGARSGGGWGRR